MVLIHTHTRTRIYLCPWLLLYLDTFVYYFLCCVFCADAVCVHFIIAIQYYIIIATIFSHFSLFLALSLSCSTGCSGNNIQMKNIALGMKWNGMERERERGKCSSQLYYKCTFDERSTLPCHHSIYHNSIGSLFSFFVIFSNAYAILLPHFLNVVLYFGAYMCCMSSASTK